MSRLVKHGLIDEYHLFINPTAIGKGMPVFGERNGKQPLRFIKSTAFSCGIVVLHDKHNR
ncbi:dihydrofolate reductase family protein [Spirosoma horti]